MKTTPENSSDDPVRHLLDQVALPEISDEQVQRVAAVVRAATRAMRAEITTALHAPPAEAIPHENLKVAPKRSVVEVLLRLKVAALIALVLIGSTVVALAATGLIDLLTVAELEANPTDIMIANEGRDAYTKTNSGMAHHFLHTDSDGGISAKGFVHEMDSNGRGALVILGFSVQSANIYPASFAAFDADKPFSPPLWKVSVEDGEIPSDLSELPGRSVNGTQFSASVCRVADIFPEPGAELVLVFQHRSSLCSLRIYDLDGKLLYLLWHDGNISEVYWMAGSQQLVCIGLNGEVYAKDRGIDGLKREYPLVLFAVTPQLGQTTPQWVKTVDHDGGIEPAWYRWIFDIPIARWDLQVRLSAPSLGDESRTHVEVTLSVTPFDDPAAFSFVVGSDGTEVLPRPSVGGPWPELQGQRVLPDPNEIILKDLPPIKNREGVWLPGTPR